MTHDDFWRHVEGLIHAGAHANKPEPYRKRLAALLDGFDAHQVAWFLHHVNYRLSRLRTRGHWLAATLAHAGACDDEDLAFEVEGIGQVRARPEVGGDVVLARKDVRVAYHLAAVVDDTYAMYLVNVSNPAAPTLSSTTVFNEYLNEVVVKNSIVYVGKSYGALARYSAANPVQRTRSSDAGVYFGLRCHALDF